MPDPIPTLKQSNVLPAHFMQLSALWCKLLITVHVLSWIPAWYIQWLYSISDHCFDDLTNYRQNCYSSIVDGIVFASDVKRCTLSYFASVSWSETMDRWGWQYGSKRLGMVYWTQHVRANQIEFATRSRWTSKNDILQM